MWHAHNETLDGGHRLRISIHQDENPISYADVIHGWQEDDNFRTFFIQLLTTSPFGAFRWETPPVTVATIHRPFEFILINSPSLARSPDRQTFSHHFQTQESIVKFYNLGHDALLVVPCPLSPSDDYSHLGAFTQQAPASQQHALWKAVGHTMAQRIGQQPVWLSTAGGGVAWLHVRLDDHPKYYHHQPYRTLC